MKSVSSVSVASVLLGAVVRAAEEGAGHVSGLCSDTLFKVLTHPDELNHSDRLRARLVCKHWMSLINREFCAQIIGKPALSDLNREDCSAGIIRCRSIGDLKHAASLANARKIPITPLWRGLPVCYREIRGPNPGSSSEEIRLRLHSEIPKGRTGGTPNFFPNCQPMMDDKVMIQNPLWEPECTFDVNSGEVEKIQVPPRIKEALLKHGVSIADLKFNVHFQNTMGEMDEWIAYAKMDFEMSYIKFIPKQDRFLSAKFFPTQLIFSQNYLSDDQSTMLACEQCENEPWTVVHVIDTRMNLIKRSIILPFIVSLLGSGPQINPPWALFNAGVKEPNRLINLETGDQIQLDYTSHHCPMHWINDELFIIEGGFMEPYCIRSVKDPQSDLVRFTALRMDGDEVGFVLEDFVMPRPVTIVAENLMATQDHFIEVQTVIPDKDKEEHKAMKQPNHHWQLAKISLVMCVPLFILSANPR